ncbi:MAG: 4Fe-4S binding protein [Syntrophobacterales bacterium]|jgi:iron only hydrogenase large subunit-like protein|nr:4Fe-4S binding protein [Syntrophobacterales bacterium]
MSDYFHSVTLDYDKCVGCTNCIKRCPVEAIRVHEGKAKIMQERCVDCGECIRACPNHAKIAITDTLEKLSSFKYKIALPAPSFFGQFSDDTKMEDIFDAFTRIGFDDIFEVALAAEIASFVVHRYLENTGSTRPLFSSACPAVLRLMQIRFPDLLGQVLPVMTPMEMAARIAKEDTAKRTGLDYEEIGAFFISPCPAKVTEMKHPMTNGISSVDGVIGVSLIYRDILKQIGKNRGSEKHGSPRKAGNIGLAWGYVTGESKGVNFGTSLAVSGIHNVISLLEEIERGELRDVDFIELQSCIGGCVGGPLNIQNLFVGRVRLRHLVKKYPAVAPYYDEEWLHGIYASSAFELSEPIQPRPIMVLDEDVSRALIKMERLDSITKDLPGLDCGACGSPSCRALAEDIVRGLAFETDCIIKLRGRLTTLAEEILDLARKPPPAMSDNSAKHDTKG